MIRRVGQFPSLFRLVRDSVIHAVPPKWFEQRYCCCCVLFVCRLPLIHYRRFASFSDDQAKRNANPLRPECSNRIVQTCPKSRGGNGLYCASPSVLCTHCEKQDEIVGRANKSPAFQWESIQRPNGRLLGPTANLTGAPCAGEAVSLLTHNRLQQDPWHLVCTQGAQSHCPCAGHTAKLSLNYNECTRWHGNIH